MSKKILITGANGQLGNEMRHVAKMSSHEFIFTDVAELDITNYEAILQLLEANKIDIIVNCAAYTAVDKAEDDRDFANLLNNVAVGYLARAAKQCNATLIHISTDYVFDGTSHKPLTEVDATNPIGVYGATKLSGEQAITESGCKHIIVRTSWLYSAFGANFVKTMLRLTAERDTLGVIFDQVGTPTYAADLAAAIVSIIDNNREDKQGIYHYSNEGVCSWYDFAIEIARQGGNSCDISPIHSSDYPAKVTRPHYSVLDKSKFKDNFGVKIPHWSDSLSRCIEALQTKK